jgi:hypothetical protein
MSAQYPTATTATSSALYVLPGLALRLKGPGGLYNLGNAIGFIGGLTAALIAIPAGAFTLAAAAGAVMNFLTGSPAALALTLATAIFFWSGEDYHRAWLRGYPPNPALNRSGDLLSAAGAILLALAFLALGNVLLALTAGLLHAAGKAGSAFRPGAGPWREVVVVSRLPAMAMAVHGLAAGDPASLIVSGVLLACCLIWAAADLMLLPPESRLSPRRYL